MINYSFVLESEQKALKTIMYNIFMLSLIPNKIKQTHCTKTNNKDNTHSPDLLLHEQLWLNIFNYHLKVSKESTLQLDKI